LRGSTWPFLAFEAAYLTVLIAEGGLDFLLDGGQCGFGQADAVGTHIGDQAGFVEALGYAHRPLYVHVQLSAGVLLEGRSSERGGRPALGWLYFNFVDLEFRSVAFVQKGFRTGFIVKAVGAFSFQQNGLSLFVTDTEDSVDAEEGLSLEGHDLALALYHQLHGNGLHPAGTEAEFHLAPQYAGKLVTDQAVQHPAGLLGVHEVHIHQPGVIDGGFDCRRGDLPEHDPFGAVYGQFQDFAKVPADGFSFAVFIRRQPNSIGLTHRGFEVFYHFTLLGRDDVLGLKALLDVYGAFALIEVTNVTEG